MDSQRKYGVLAFLLGVSLISTACAPMVVSGAATSAAMVSDRRTSGTIMDDKSIELKALRLLSQKKDLWRHSHITVVSYNNVLLLVGQTPTEAMKQEAEARISGIKRVRVIYNEIEVKPPISMKERGADTWITTQIKARLLNSEHLRPSRVKVVTEDRVVYLLGLLNEHEEEEAVSLAQEVKGVERVVKIFEPA